MGMQVFIVRKDLLRSLAQGRELTQTELLKLKVFLWTQVQLQGNRCDLGQHLWPGPGGRTRVACGILGGQNSWHPANQSPGTRINIWINAEIPATKTVGRSHEKG